MTDPFGRAQGVADALLWEGYVLYPYRSSAVKNQLRWQFGVLTPRAYSEADGYERWSMTTECVVEARPDATVDVRIRMLQVQTREDGWEEAVEHTIDASGIDPSVQSTREVLIDLPEGAGILRVESDPAGDAHSLTKLSVTVENTTDWNEPGATRAQAMRRSFIAVHTLLHADGGTFVSLLDPPDYACDLVASCVNDGTFPVLMGTPENPTLVLSSPIILYDFPTIAPTSQGDMCDATEIDEMLALRVLTLTDEEKRQARGTDPRAAAIVDRIEGLSDDALAGLHADTLTAAWWDPASEAEVNPWEDSVIVAGVAIQKGSRVRLRPGAMVGRRTDAQDLFLAGMTATVEGVFLDVEGDHHVAVVVDGDADFGLRPDTRRFRYFHPDEVEPLT